MAASLSSAISCRCPARPKPVTSAMAWTPCGEVWVGGGFGGVSVEGHHLVDGGIPVFLGDCALLVGSDEDAGADLLGQDDGVAGLRASGGADQVSGDFSGDGEAVLGFFVDDGVSAGDDGACFADLVGSAAEDVGDDVGGEILGEGGDVEGEEDASAHGVDVGHGVGGGDRAELVGVVDERGEEVEGLDERAIVIDRVDGGVVGARESDEQLGVLGGRELGTEMAQHVSQALGAELGASTAAAGEVGEADGPVVAIGHGAVDSNLKRSVSRVWTDSMIVLEFYGGAA